MISRKLFAIHGILGLVAGALLLVISLSGSILIFNQEIDSQLNPALLKVTAGNKKASLDSIYSKAKNIFPSQYIRFRNLPGAADEAIELSVEQNDEWTFAYFDPYTGHYLGSRDAENYFLGWLLRLHYGLLAGKAGELLVAILAVTLILSTLTGIYVYRKHILKVLTFKVCINLKNGGRALSSLHRVIGVWSVVFNLLFAITGFWMLRYAFFPETYREEKPAAKTGNNVAISLDSLRNSIEADKSFNINSIYMPRKAEDKIIIYGSVPKQNTIYTRYVNTIEVDGVTGREVTRSIITDQSAWNKWDMIAFPLHAALYGNLLVKIIYCVAGLSPALLSISGFLLWLKRKKHLSK